MNYISSDGPITGVVLAGGKSSRFGHDKGLFPFRGKALVEHAIKILEPVCSEILISTNKPDDYSFTGIKTITDLYPGCGPVGGMHSGLYHAKGEVVLFLGCDMPFVDSLVFSFLLKNMGANHAAVAVHNGFRETLCMAMKKESLPLVEQALEQKKYRIIEMLEPMQVCYTELSALSFYHNQMFHNINRPDDLPAD